MPRELRLAEPGPMPEGTPPCCHSRSSNIEGPAYRKGKKLMVVMATVENTLELPPRPASSFFKLHKPETEVEF